VPSPALLDELPPLSLELLPPHADSATALTAAIAPAAIPERARRHPDPLRPIVSPSSFGALAPTRVAWSAPSVGALIGAPGATSATTVDEAETKCKPTGRNFILFGLIYAAELAF
jgi:hypothetical protein